MSVPESKIVKIVDESVHTRGVSVEQVGLQGAMIAKIVEMPAVSVDTTGLALDNTLMDGSQTVKLVDGSNTPVAITGGELQVLANLGQAGTDIGSIRTEQTDGTAKTQIVDGSANVVSVTNNRLDVNATASLAGTALPISGATDGVGVAILDGSGNQITSFGGGTQYTAGDNDITPTGTLALAESDATPGDMVSLMVDSAANHNLKTVDAYSSTIANSVGTLEYVVKDEDTAFGAGDSVSMVGAVRNDSFATFTDADGDVSAISVDEWGRVNVTNPALDKLDGGTVELTAFQGGSWTVDGPVTDAELRASPVDVNALFGPGTLDEFGHMVTGSVNNQIDVQFYRSDGSVGDLVTETNANGGTATATNGMATFSATTTASSQAKGVSTVTTTYTAGAEIYCIFTAGWTGSGSGTSYQRIGLYNGTDGFYIGFEGGTFGASIIKGGSPTQTPKASFSEDTLAGTAGSKFTRNGVIEAINLANLNVFRIRFGWVGSAPVNFEVLSPDGNWVTFHRILQPNLSALPHINTADLPVTCDVFSGNSGQALTLITNCWAAGTTQSLSKLNSTISSNTLAGLTRAVITGETTAGGGAFVNVKVNPSGTLETNASVASVVPGTAATNLGKAEDAIHNSGDVGVMALAVRNDSGSNTFAGAIGDYSPIATDARGNVYTTLISGTAEIASSGAGADGINNTSRGLVVYDRPSVFNGTTWDRLKGDATNGMVVDLGSNNDVTVTSGAITETNSGAIKTAVELIDNAIAGTEMQVDVVAALPAGDNNVGNVDIVTLPGTGVEDAGETAGGTLLMAGAVRRDTPASSSGSTGDNSTLNTDAQGRLWTHNMPNAQDLATLATPHVKKYYTNAGAVTDGIIWSPAAGARWFITDIYIQVSAAATVTLEDDLSGGDSPIWKAELAANSGWSHSFTTPWFSGEDAADLIITTTAGNVYVTCVGYEI